MNNIAIQRHIAILAQTHLKIPSQSHESYIKASLSLDKNLLHTKINHNYYNFLSLIIIYLPTRTRRNKPLVDRPPRTPRISLQSFSQKPPEFAFLLSGNIPCRKSAPWKSGTGSRNSAGIPLFIFLFGTNSG